MRRTWENGLCALASTADAQLKQHPAIRGLELYNSRIALDAQIGGVQPMRPRLRRPAKDRSCGRQNIWGKRHGLGAIEVEIGQAVRRGPELDANILAAPVKEARRRGFVDNALLPVAIDGFFLLEWDRHWIPTTPDVEKRYVEDSCHGFDRCVT